MSLPNDTTPQKLTWGPSPSLGIDRAWLEARYITEGLDCVQIGRLVDRDAKSVWVWLRHFGIPTRTRGGHTMTHAFRKGAPSLFTGLKHTAEAKAKIRALRLADGHAPYIRDGKHWLHTVPSDQHPHWKGGVSPERQAFYASAEWKQSVKAVWHRDGAACRRCTVHHNTRERRGTFHIHHIVSFAVRELRAELSNLVLLCKSCHLFVHSKANVAREFLPPTEQASE